MSHMDETFAPLIKLSSVPLAGTCCTYPLPDIVVLLILSRQRSTDGLPIQVEQEDIEGEGDEWILSICIELLIRNSKIY